MDTFLTIVFLIVGSIVAFKLWKYNIYNENAEELSRYIQDKKREYAKEDDGLPSWIITAVLNVDKDELHHNYKC